jgi:hypothetical protein
MGPHAERIRLRAAVSDFDRTAIVKTRNIRLGRRIWFRGEHTMLKKNVT